MSEIFELGTEELINIAVENNEGVIASNGALSLETGEPHLCHPMLRMGMPVVHSTSLRTGLHSIDASDPTHSCRHKCRRPSFFRICHFQSTLI